jgi:hypothetical protein
MGVLRRSKAMRFVRPFAARECTGNNGFTARDLRRLKRLAGKICLIGGVDAGKSVLDVECLTKGLSAIWGDDSFEINHMP